LLGQTTYTERPIPPLVEEETPSPSSDHGGDTQRGRRSHKPALGKWSIKVLVDDNFNHLGQWQSLVNTTINLPVSLRAGNFLTGTATIDVPTRIVPHDDI
jgi:hypothetical protein